MKKTIEDIAEQDGRYNPRGLKFVFDGLTHTIDKFHQNEDPESPARHITGQELCLGLADLAVQRWGRLAGMVLHKWGICRTRDFGEIVYLMISYGWMTSQETDVIEDFDDVFDFVEFFERDYTIELR